MIKIFSYPEWFIPWGFYIAKYVNEKAQILPISHKTKQTSKPQKRCGKDSIELRIGYPYSVYTKAYT